MIYYKKNLAEGGIAMIELLISLLIVVIGILGLAALQFAALKYNRSSYERSQATLLVYEMADKLRANRSQAYNGAYAFLRSAPPSTTPTKDCTSNSCSSSELASYELSTWYNRVQTALPGSQAEITCVKSTCTTGAQQQVTVFWPESTVSKVNLVNCPSAVSPAAGYSCVTAALYP